MQASWELLDLISAKTQIHDILIDLAGKIGDASGEPPVFRKNWFYFVAEAQFRKAKSIPP